MFFEKNWSDSASSCDQCLSEWHQIQKKNCLCISEEKKQICSNFDFNSTLELIMACNGTQPVSEPKWRPKI